MSTDNDFTIISDNKSTKCSKVCECGKICEVLSTFYKHRKKCEIAKNKIDLGNFPCKEASCDLYFKRAKSLEDHLKSAHNIEAQTDVKHFQSYTEFKSWKGSFEKKTKAYFIFKCAKKDTLNRREYFYCNRSGNYTRQSTGKRGIKSQGLRKIGFNCLASIIAEVNEENGSVTATIHPLHYGHDNELAHISIPLTDRKLIASQLSQGIQPSRVLRNVFTDESEEIERKHICTKQDLSNISRAYGLERAKHSEDHISVDLHVQEKLETEKSILFYKRQGEEELFFPKNEFCPLQKEDFVLGMMTEFQKTMLLKFGNNIICVDATHGTNKYDFKLITLLVVDEFREGIPVAWLISNKETSLVLSMFFSYIKKEVGNISPGVFMCDKAPQYFNSWKEIFDGEPKKLLCHWHVHQDWQRHLNKIKDKDTASTIYKALCVLLEESSEERFEVLLKNICEKLASDPCTFEFGKYFESEWVYIKQEWGKCFRIGSGINTNMFMESFHKKIKYGDAYLQGKHGKRIDKFLSVLTDFSKDMSIQRLIKLEKGKNTWKSTEINKRHKSALNLPDTLIQRVSDEKWNVKSAKSINSATSSGDLHYTIQKFRACQRNCKIKCAECNICLHSFSCNCPDGVTGTTICKHIHLLALNTNKHLEQNSKQINPNSDRESREDFMEMTEIDSFQANTREKLYSEKKTLFKSINSDSDDIETLKNKLLSKCKELSEIIEQCNDRELLLTVKDNINSSYNLLSLSHINSESTQLNSVQSNVPHNKKIEKQLRFFSTKKKQPKRGIKYAKPTFDEKIDIESSILNDSHSKSHNEHPYSKQAPIEKYLIESHTEREENKEERQHLHTEQTVSVKPVRDRSLENPVMHFLKHFISTEKVDSIILENGKADEIDIEIVPDKIADSVIDISSKKIISSAKKFVTDDAWLIINNILKIKKKEWTCAGCDEITSKLNMISCDKCLHWFHWKCQNVVTEPKQDRWECQKCMSTKFENKRKRLCLKTKCK